MIYLVAIVMIFAFLAWRFMDATTFRNLRELLAILLAIIIIMAIRMLMY